jgi:ABC-type polysaccharide/polyol phosphate export permease
MLALARPFGIDLFCFGKKFLVFNMVGRNLKVKYRRSLMGVLWTLLAPIGMGAMYYLVFAKILKIPIPHYLAYVLSGIFPWTFFSQTVMEGMESLIGNWGILTKIPVPIQVFPLVGTLTNLITLGFAFVVMLAAALGTGVNLGPSLVLMPYVFALLFFAAYGIALILAILMVLLRDLKHAMGIVMQVWLYATPVLYQDAMIPAKYHWILYANPVGVLFRDMHLIMTEGAWPSQSDLLIGTGWSIALLLAAALLQRFMGGGLMEIL